MLEVNLKPVRRLTLIDIFPVLGEHSPRVAEMEELLAQLSKSGTRPKLSAMEVADALRCPNTRMYAVCTNMHEILAMSFLHIKYEVTGTSAVIEKFVVHNEYRGLSLGKRLAQTLIDEARVLGVKKIELTSAYVRQDARRLYASLGFADRTDTGVMTLDL